MYKPTVYGIGYIGGTDYTCTTSGKKNKDYNTWANMLRRCYSEAYQRDKPTYIGCTVVEEWHNFQTFAEWYGSQENAFLPGYALDKDIRVPGNKVYGPDTCSIVTTAANNRESFKRNPHIRMNLLNLDADPKENIAHKRRPSYSKESDAAIHAQKLLRSLLR